MQVVESGFTKPRICSSRQGSYSARVTGGAGTRCVFLPLLSFNPTWQNLFLLRVRENSSPFIHLAKAQTHGSSHSGKTQEEEPQKWTASLWSWFHNTKATCGCHGGRADARRHGNWKAGTRAANSQLNPSASARPHHDRPRPRVEKTTVACLPFDAGGARTNEEEKADRPI